MPVTYLHRRLCRLSTLRLAWLHVEEADGCAGVDNVTISAFARNLETELHRLSDELAKDDYQPLPLVRFFIQKINGQQRPLSVPAVRDRVVQNGIIGVAGPIFEKEFDNCSFAYRKGRSVKQALQQIEFLHEAGYEWLVDADITSYFDNVDHGLLLSRVAELIPDEKIVGLIRGSIAARIYDGHHLTKLEKGLPQGAPISPLLANLYLDTFDDRMLASGQKLVRFADDFVVLCKSKPRAEAALRLTKHVLSGLRLRLNEEKTRITSFADGFKYLGAMFTGGLTLVPPASHAEASSPVTMPPPLPVLRAAPFRSRPFNPAIKDALLHAFEDVAADEIPSFFQRPRERPDQTDVPQASQPVALESATRAVSEPGAVATGSTIALPDSVQASAFECALRSTDLDLIDSSEARQPDELASKADPTSSGAGQIVVEDSSTGGRGHDGGDLPEPPRPNQPKLPPPTLLTLRTLYIHEHGATIRCEDEHLRVFDKDNVELLSLPAFKIDQMILFGNSQVTTGAMKFCLRHNIPIIVLNGLGHFFGAIESTGNQNVVLQQKQFERLADQSFVLNTARQIVAAKISNCRTLLQRRHRDKPDNRLAQSINELLALRSKLPSATTLDEIRGCEGAAAASYFAGFASCVPQSFLFSKRTRQPPLDPVNALLSFGYTLLFYNIYAIVRARGLTPYVGSLHALRQGHPALCSDLIEELRAPVIDSLVTSLLNKMVFSPADFYYDEPGSAGIPPADRPASLPAGTARLSLPKAESEPPALAGGSSVSEPRAVATGSSATSPVSADLSALENADRGEALDQSATRIPQSEISPSGCFLTDQARRTFVAQFEQRMNTLLLHPRTRFRTTWRGCIDLQVTTFIKALRGEIEMYYPLEIR